jgi:hypothetical protein
MGNIFSSLVVTFALLLAATGIGVWAAATTTDNARPYHFELQVGSQLELPR